jgi:AcrR family transcriptional regulator
MLKRKADKPQPRGAPLTPAHVGGAAGCCQASKAERKAPYHHGDLREALIAATRQLVMERGAENFTLADACRAAGVTTAAPYRHFRNKQQILEEIASRGFAEMRARSMAVVAEKGAGTLEAIVAMGQAYVAFAIHETAMFRLMFGQDPALKKTAMVSGAGHECLAQVVEQITLYCRNNRVKGDALEIALRLWTFVHGAACLQVDKDYLAIAPALDVNRLIADGAPGLLGAKTPTGHPARSNASRR